MDSTLNFSKIRNRYVFEMEFKLITPIHIGGNQEEAVTSDNPVIKDTEGNAFIPGSSIKGVLRSASDRLVHLLVDDKIPSCYLLNNGCKPHTEQDVKEIKDELQLYNVIYEKLCPVCRTYGGGSIASKVKVNHVLFPKGVKTRVRTGNSIDRETGTAKNGALFNYEYIQPNQHFNMVVEAENVTAENLKVLAIALTQLQQNMLRLGGKQAKGLGQIEYIRGNVTKSIYDEQNKAEALATLLGLGEKNVQDLSAFLDELFNQEVK